MTRSFDIDDDYCTGCGLCQERAPENFAMPNGATIARVQRQPQGEDESVACEEAAEYCPTGAIRDLDAKAA